MAKLLDVVLAGVEAELALERELGVLRLDIDRNLLKKVEVKGAAASAPPARHQAPPAPRIPNYIFAHTGTFSGEAKMMMNKLIAHIHYTNRIIVEDSSLPPADTYILLGSGARDLWFRSYRQMDYGVWTTVPGRGHIIMTRDPNEVVRYGLNSPVSQPKKAEFWRMIKGVLERYGEV